MGSLLLEAGEALVARFIQSYLFSAPNAASFLIAQELPELCDGGDDQSREVGHLNRGAA